MKIYSLVSPSHTIFQDEWFLPSLKDDFTVVIENLPQAGSGEIGTKDFNRCMQAKVKLILRAIQENWGETFIYSDVDVQFLAPISDAVKQSLRDYDIAFQRESPTGHLCAGFFAAQANESTKSLWEEIEKRLIEDDSIHDQEALNEVVSPESVRSSLPAAFYRVLFGLGRQLRLSLRLPLIAGPIERRYRMKLVNCGTWKIGLLPTTFFGGGTFTGRLWNAGDELPIPLKSLMHHANYTIGIDNKIAQLNYVRNATSSPSKSLPN